MAIRPIQMRDAHENLMPHSFSMQSFVVSKAGTGYVRYTGYARAGTKLEEAGWLISRNTYDSVGTLIRVEFALTSSGLLDYEKIWQGLTYKTISSVTNVDPAVFTTTTAHGLTTGNVIEIIDSDLTEINGDGNGLLLYSVKVLTTTTASLVDIVTGLDIDGSAFASAATSGKVYFRDYANYTFV